MISTILRLTSSNPQDPVRGRVVDINRLMACEAGGAGLRAEPFGGASIKDLPSFVGNSFSLTEQEATELAELNQFEADDVFSEKFDTGHWFGPISHALTDFRIDEIVGADEVEIGADLDDREAVARLQTIAVFGPESEPVVDFLIGLSRLTSARWNVVRTLAGREFEFGAELASSEMEAIQQIIVRGTDARIVGLLQYWARYIGFRGSHAALAEVMPPEKLALEWDGAWAAWASDLARRAALELYAELPSRGRFSRAYHFFDAENYD